VGVREMVVGVMAWMVSGVSDEVPKAATGVEAEVEKRADQAQGAGVQVYHVQEGGSLGGEVEKTFAVGQHGEEDVTGDGEGLDQFAIMVVEGDAG
jgi:hypothetical protein